MTLFTVVQFLLDGAFVYFAYRLWQKVQKPTDAAGNGEIKQETLKGVIDSLEQKQKDWETQIQTQKNVFDERIRSLNSICEQAGKILRQSRVAPGTCGTSKEENEIRETITAQIEKLPSIQQIEQTRQRIKSDIPIDLRSVLRDQLA
jgi:hypothetical protein